MLHHVVLKGKAGLCASQYNEGRILASVFVSAFFSIFVSVFMIVFVAVCILLYISRQSCVHHSTMNCCVHHNTMKGGLLELEVKTFTPTMCAAPY